MEPQKENKKIKLALIGCGAWGRNYVKTLNNIQEAELKYIVDIKKPDIEIGNTIFTENLDKVLNNKEIKAVIVAVPTENIFELTKKCLEAGKNVLMEKPMTNSSEKALKLVKLAENKALILMVGHLYCYNPAIIKLKGLIESGELGKILYCFSLKTSFQIRKNINVLWDMGCHDISVFLYLFNKKPEEISGFSSQNEIDAVSFCMKFNDIFVESHIRGIDIERNRKLIVIGEKKIAMFDDDVLTIYNKNKEIITESFIVETEQTSSLEKQCRHFLDCLKQNKKPLTDGKNGYEVVKIIEEIERKNKK